MRAVSATRAHVVRFQPDMAWTVKKYSKRQIDQAGEILVADDAPDVDTSGATLEDEIAAHRRYSEALDIVHNWRSCHSFPLNTFQVALRRVSRSIDPNALIAQRIKRISSIESKLRRFRDMRLSRMQDMGGCRSVVATVDDVEAIAGLFLTRKFRHNLHRGDNYIKTPQRTGYRGVHLVWRYQTLNAKYKVFNGLSIEMQIRSKLQHAWATAVETVGTFTRQALKSSQGEEEWLRFFALMGSALALREGTPIVPGTPEDPEQLARDLREACLSLDVESRLRNYHLALRYTQHKQHIEPGARFYLLAFDRKAYQLRITSFKRGEIHRAAELYLESERNSNDAVLVSVESMEALRRAYPNYFLDTTVFLSALKTATAEESRGRLVRRLRDVMRDARKRDREPKR